jgi:hypothetical protein
MAENLAIAAETEMRKCEWTEICDVFFQGGELNAHRADSFPDRQHLERLLVGRGIEPALRDRTDYISAFHQAPRRPSDCHPLPI